MKGELAGRLQQMGWEELYEAYIKDLAPVNARGERRACSPFPDTIDRHASFSVNVNSGLWNCFKTERGGDYIRFRAIIDADEFDPTTGLATEDYAAAERRVMQEVGLSNIIDADFVDSCKETLYSDLALRTSIQRFKPWNAEVLYQLKIGYSTEHNRFVFPVYDRKGKLVNCRMYRPGHDPKFVWLESNAGGNFLWPHRGWHEKQLILCEGEPDATSLRSFGFPAVSGTIGAGSPVPDGEWWRGKTVYVLMDSDSKGQDAAIEACRRMTELALEVRVVKLPEWDGRPSNADVSDYIVWLLQSNYQFEQIQRAISALLMTSEKVESPTTYLDQAALEQNFSNALTSENINRRVKFIARVTAKSTSRFMLPTAYNITCPAEGHAYCRNCLMRNQFHGNGRFLHDPRIANSLKLIQTTQEKQLDTYKEMLGIPSQCPDVRASTLQSVDVEAVILNASVTEGILDEGDVERARREAYVIVTPGNKLEENRDYEMEGFVYPHPRSQQAIFLIDKFSPYANSYDNYQYTHEVSKALEIFRPAQNETVFQKLQDVANDLAESTSMIMGRQDLHLAYRTVWHSAISFNFSGKPLHRGWIECLVLGDTRCGKSEAFRQLSHFYGLGVLIDCKMQSVPGILGTVVQAASGEYYVVAGLLPQQDRRIVCFDEFTVPKNAGQSIIEILSSTRSEGVVRIAKAASAEFSARVRSIWLANPGFGRLVSQSSDTGVELIKRLITQPEDIARFDFALTVSQTDVDPTVINCIRRPPPPRYSRDLSRMLLSWVYSRKADQIEFTSRAESAIIDLALRMHKKYDSTIPLVEIADQRNRVAKVAVSIAGQCYSTDAVGEKLIVEAEHVEAAEQLFTTWYDKPVMGYDEFSFRTQKEQDLIDEPRVRDIFDTVVAPYGMRFAEELLRLDEVSERTIATIVPAENIFMRTILQTMYHSRAIHLVWRGKKDAYEKTPAFTSWLKNYLSNADTTTSCDSLSRYNMETVPG